MQYKQIICGISDHILTITLNRPEKLNAYTITMMHELIDAFEKADTDDNVRVVVVTGAGRAFCAGADLSSGADTFNYDNMIDGDSPIRGNGTIDYQHPAVRDYGGMTSLRIYQCLKPVIAAINGPAVGIGVTMTLPMDIRLMAEGAKIGFAFARRGIVPEAASSFFLPRTVGINRALEWCLTGRMVTAQEALIAGYAHSIHPSEALLPAAYSIAREIADNVAPVSAALTRQMLWRSFSQGHPMEAHRIDSRAVYSRGRTADAVEGVTSFLEKRAPRFEGRVTRDMPDFFPWFEEPEYK